MQIAGNVCTPSSLAADCGADYTGVVWPADHYSKAKLSVTGSGGAGQGACLSVRSASGARTCYRLEVDHAATNNVAVEKFVAGTPSALIGPLTQAWTDGDTWEIRAQGNRISIYLNGVLVGSATDSSSPLLTGNVGIGYSSVETAASVEDWEGGDFVAAPLLPQAFTAPLTLLRCRPLGPDNPMRAVDWGLPAASVDTALTVDDATIALTSDAVDLVQANTLAVNDATVALTSDAIALTQANTLAVNDATVALTSDPIALTQANTLAVNDATVALASDPVALVQQNTLAVDDALIALSADNVTVDTASQLVVQDATVALASDPVALTQANTLAVDDAFVALSADSPAVTMDGTTVAVPEYWRGGAGREEFQPRFLKPTARAVTARAAAKLVLQTSARAITTAELRHTGVTTPAPRPRVARPAEETQEFRSVARARARLRIKASARAAGIAQGRARAVLTFETHSLAYTEWENDDAEIMAAVMLLEEDTVLA